MNKVMLMGRLTRDPEVTYTQSANPIAIAKYGIAVRRQRAKQGDPEVDFFNVVAFGKAAEFVQKWFRKGNMILVAGRLQVSTWEDQQKVKHTSVDVIAEEQHFTGAKHSDKSGEGSQVDASSFTPKDEEDDLPF